MQVDAYHCQEFSSLSTETQHLCDKVLSTEELRVAITFYKDSIHLGVKIIYFFGKRKGLRDFELLSFASYRSTFKVQNI